MKPRKTGYATIDEPLPALAYNNTDHHEAGALLYLPPLTVLRYVMWAHTARLTVLHGPLCGSYDTGPKAFAARTHAATPLELLSLHADE